MFTLQEKLFLIIVDLILVVSSILLALTVRFFEEPNGLPLMLNWLEGARLAEIIGLSLACIVVFFFFDLYGKVWRYAGINELISIFTAVTLCFFVSSVPVFISGGRYFPRSVIVISWLFCLMLVGGVRMLLKWASLRQKRIPPVIVKRLLVVGTGDGAEAYVREILRQKEIHYRPVGFIALEEKKKNLKIHGVQVLGVVDDIPSVVPKYRIDQITIALPVVSGQLINKIMNMGQSLGVNISIIPSVSEIMDGKITLTQTREIQIEDLLGREPVKFDNPEIADFIKGRKILVTGAGGSIGKELCRQILNFKPESLILLGHGENSIHEVWLALHDRAGGVKLNQVIADIQNKEKLSVIFEKFRPEIVFHAAAHKHVPLMEENPDEAIANNILGTRNIAFMSGRYGVKKFVMVSTDKAVSPASVMGATKKIAENVVRAYSSSSETQFMIVRFGNVLGSRGSVVQTFKGQISKGGPVTVTDPDMTRYFMTAPEAVLLILLAASTGKGGETFILDMGRPINILKLATSIIELSGYKPDRDIPIIFTGVRQGDKLTEKLYDETLEELGKTRHEKILLVNIRQAVDYNKVLQDVEILEKLLHAQDPQNLLKKFKDLVPTVTQDFENITVSEKKCK